MGAEYVLSGWFFTAGGWIIILTENGCMSRRIGRNNRGWIYLEFCNDKKLLGKGI